MEKKTVLVTGASSGIGRAAAREFARRGWTVYGTTRRLPPGAVQTQDGYPMIALDVTDDASAAAAVALVLQREGRLDALVNNAGYGIAGALEDTPLEDALAQFDTNLWGCYRMVRAALPALRASRGVIINVSSVAGLLTIPYQAFYSASKAALEALSEALRMEVRTQGVRVCLVEPGDTATGFTASRVTAQASAPYRQRMAASLARMEKDERAGSPPEQSARVIRRMAERRRPPVRRTVGAGYFALVFARRLLPDRFKIWVLGLLYG